MNSDGSSGNHQSLLIVLLHQGRGLLSYPKF